MRKIMLNTASKMLDDKCTKKEAPHVRGGYNWRAVVSGIQNHVLEFLRLVIKAERAIKTVF